MITTAEFRTEADCSSKEIRFISLSFNTSNRARAEPLFEPN